jgi:uncharacterized membrane protein
VNPSQSHSASRPADSVAAARRIAAIDMLRGAAIVLMVLDHARFYFDNTPIEPIQIDEVRPTWFFVQWLLQFCAPVFALLAGTGAYLRLAAGRSKREVSKFLATRGLILIILDLFIMPLVKWFNFDWLHLSAGPLWALGWSMIGLAGLIFFRVGVVTIVGLAIVVLHNALDRIHADSLGAMSGLWKVLHEPGAVAIGPWIGFDVSWPLLPWVGVMACGFGLGYLYRIPMHLRRTMLAGMGLNLLVWFLIFRGFNLYGDPLDWSRQDTFVRSMMSFVHCTQQPPSLCFLLMTLAPALLLLGWFEGRRSWRLEALASLGCVPLYCYVAHWLLLHALAIGISVMRGKPTGWLFQAPVEAGNRAANWLPDFGIELTLAVLLGLAATAALYFSARRYAQLKFLRRPRWASYF